METALMRTSEETRVCDVHEEGSWTRECDRFLLRVCFLAD